METQDDKLLSTDAPTFIYDKRVGDTVPLYIYNATTPNSTFAGAATGGRLSSEQESYYYNLIKNATPGANILADSKEGLANQLAGNTYSANYNQGKDFASTISAPITSTQTQQSSSYTGPSVVDYLNSIGQDTSFSSRLQLAQSMGISSYTGTPSQNTLLLSKLRQQTPQTQQQQQTPTGTQTTQTGAVSPTTTPSTAISLTTGNLQTGASGTSVTQLQNFLNSQGAGLEVDGKFGPITKQAVMEFQSANGLTPDGIVGPLTAKKINELAGQKQQQSQQAVTQSLESKGVDTATVVNGFQSDPIGTLQDIVKTMYQDVGLDTIKSQIDETIKQKRELEDEIANKVTEIENNPWLSESLKSKKITALQSNYETKLNNLIDYLDLMGNEYDKTVEDIRWTATTALDQYNANRTFDENQKQNAFDNAIKMAQLQVDQNKLESGIVGEYQYAVQQGYTGSFTQYQNEDANRKASIAKAGASTTILPTTQDLTTKETSEALGTVNSIGNILSSANFDTTFGITGLVKSKIPGTPEYTLASQIQQVKDKLSLAARGQLKGQGQVSNFEGLMLQNAQTSLKFGMKPEDARQELINIQGALTTSTGGQAKVQITNPQNGETSTVFANSLGITQAIADGLQVRYIQ